jgi:hypothetical protein
MIFLVDRQVLLPQQELIAVERRIGLRASRDRRRANLGSAAWAFDEPPGELFLVVIRFAARATDDKRLALTPQKSWRMCGLPKKTAVERPL